MAKGATCEAERLREAQEAPPTEGPQEAKAHLSRGDGARRGGGQQDPQPGGYEMSGCNLGRFSITYRPVKLGWPGIGGTHSFHFNPCK